MIVRPPWSKALHLEWHRPRLARRIRGERYHAALERHAQAHRREMIESVSGVHPVSRGHDGKVWVVVPK